MKKKKIITGATITAMAALLLACGTDQSDVGAYTVSVEKIEKPVQVQTGNTQAAETASTENAAAEQSASDGVSAFDPAVYNQIQEETKNYSGQSQDGTESVKGSYQEFVLPSELADTGLGKALQKFNKAEENLTQKNISDYADEAADMMNAANAFVTTPYEFDTKLTIMRADAQYFSFVTEDYSDMHGAHPSTGHRAYTYDTETGAEVKLSDLVTGTDSLAARLAKNLLNAFGRETFMDPDNLTGSIQSMMDTPETQGQMIWYLGDNHTITFLFPQDALAPYAAGEQSLTYDLDKLDSNTDDALTASSR